MIDRIHLKDVLTEYKQDFISSQWKKEKFKWEAVKCFQDNWDVNAADFAEMLARSLSKTANLLASINNYPRETITKFAETEPEEVRSMFIALFDENEDVYERINAFKTKSEVLLEKYGNGARQHFQSENAISVYLWLRCPDEYYVYKYSEIKTVAKELKSSYRFKKGAYADNIRNFYRLYDEICDEVKKDTELVDLFKSQLTESCYPDPQLRTLTFDVGFYISRKNLKKAEEKEEWFPEQYNPDLKVEDWIQLLNDKEVFTDSGLEIVKRMKDYGGQATCTQLAEK